MFELPFEATRNTNTTRQLNSTTSFFFFLNFGQHLVPAAPSSFASGEFLPTWADIEMWHLQNVPSAVDKRLDNEIRCVLWLVGLSEIISLCPQMVPSWVK